MVPVPAWLIEGAGSRILVDTGTGTAAAVQSAQRQYGLIRSVETPPENDIVAQLQCIGVRPSEIDLVIHTHLHFDHIAGNNHFPRAKFLIHHAEIAWALCPPRYAETYYFPQFRHYVEQVLDRVVLMAADVHQVTPQVRVVHTGGHSPGHCVVFVETALGKVVIGGDAVFNYTNLEESWPQGFLFDLTATLRSMEILRQADVILLNHDSYFSELFPTNRIGDAALSATTEAYMRRLRTPHQSD